MLLIGGRRATRPCDGRATRAAFQRFATHKERVDERAAGVNPHLGDEERAQLVDEIDAEELAKGSQTATAGFVRLGVQSVSVLWGVADAGVRA